MRCNVRVVWRRSTLLDRPDTLFAELPGLLSLEGGIGNQLTDGVGQELADGLLNLLTVMEILPEADLPFHWATVQRPTVATDDDVVRVRAERGGLFLPAGSPGARVAAGELLGEVVEPYAGEVREAILSPVAGRLMAVREQPVVYPGSMVARLLADRSAA
jgi:predicted deacylase